MFLLDNSLILDYSLCGSLILVVSCCSLLVSFLSCDILSCLHYCYVFVSFFLLVSSVIFLFFFFFNQKPAYEMRISDCSSDVCSSDLGGQRRRQRDGQRGVEHDPLRLGFLTPDPQLLAGLVGEDVGGRELRAGARRGRHADRRDAGSGQRMGGQGVVHGAVPARRDGGGQLADVEIGRATCRERVCQYV